MVIGINSTTLKLHKVDHRTYRKAQAALEYEFSIGKSPYS